MIHSLQEIFLKAHSFGCKKSRLLQLLRTGILKACWGRKLAVHCPCHGAVELDTAGLHADADGVNFLASLLLGTLET